MNSVLVTGGAGFVGSSLAIGIRQHNPGFRVISFDNLKRRGSEINIRRLRDAGVVFIHGDIRNSADFDSVGPIDLMIECSAEASVLAGYNSSPNYLVDTNLTGTINCLEIARKCKAAIIFISTSRVYPIRLLNEISFRESPTCFVLTDDQSIPGVSCRGISEAFPLQGNRSLYGATKLCSEFILLEYLDMYSLNGIINRCGVIAGPWQMGKADQGFVALWALRHILGGPLNYIGYGGKGQQVRDILHIDDLLELVLRQMDNLQRLSGTIFNVGGGLANSISLQELTALCQERSGNTIFISAESPDRPGDIRIYITDNSRITSMTGWEPHKTISTTISDVCTWIEDNRDILRFILHQA